MKKMDEFEMTDAELDMQLNSEEQIQIRQFVQSMRDEPVSMAWRSELNEQIQSKIQVRRRKRLFAWTLSPALGLGLAGALAVSIFMKTPDSPKFESRPTSNLEKNLVVSFENRMSYSDVTGVGLNPDEVVNGKSVVTIEDLPEVDLGSL